MKKLAILGIIALAHTAQAGYLEDGNSYFKNNNYPKAEQMFLEASQKGEIEAMYNLGILYYNQNDRINAKKYVKQASDLGYEEAQEVYKKMLQAGY